MRGCHSGHGFLEVMAMKEKFLQEVLYLWTEHRGKFLGTVLGVLFGLCVLVFGFWRTFFVLLCGSIGLFIGSRFDRGDFLEELRDRIPDRLQYWHRF